MPRYLAINYFRNHELSQRRSCFSLQTNYKKEIGNTSQNCDSQKHDCQEPSLYDSDLFNETIADEFLNNTIEDLQSSGDSPETSDGDEEETQYSFQEPPAKKYVFKNMDISKTIPNIGPKYHNLEACYVNPKQSERPNNVDVCLTKTNMKNILNDDIHQLVASYKKNEMKSGYNFGYNDKLISQSNSINNIEDFVDDVPDSVMNDLQFSMDEFTNDAFDNTDLSSIEDFVIIDAIDDSKEDDNSLNCADDIVDHLQISAETSEVQNTSVAPVIAVNLISNEIHCTNHDSMMSQEIPEIIVNKNKEISSPALIANLKIHRETNQQFKEDDKIDNSTTENSSEVNHKGDIFHDINGDDLKIADAITRKQIINNSSSTDVEATNDIIAVRINSYDCGGGDDDDGVKLLKSRPELINNISMDNINFHIPSLHCDTHSIQGMNINSSDILAGRLTYTTELNGLADKLVTSNTKVDSNFNDSIETNKEASFDQEIDVDSIDKYTEELLKSDEEIVVNISEICSEPFVNEKIKDNIACTEANNELKLTPRTLICHEVISQISSVKDDFGSDDFECKVEVVSIFVDEDAVHKKNDDEMLVDVAIGDCIIDDHDASKCDLHDERGDDAIESSHCNSKDGNPKRLITESDISNSKHLSPKLSAQEITNDNMEEPNNKIFDDGVGGNIERCGPIVTCLPTFTSSHNLNIHEGDDKSLTGENVAMEPCNGDITMANMIPIDLSFSNLTKCQDKEDINQTKELIHHSNSADGQVNDISKNSSDVDNPKVAREICKQTNNNNSRTISSDQVLAIPSKPFNLVTSFVSSITSHMLTSSSVARIITASSTIDSITSSTDTSSPIVKNTLSQNLSTKVSDAESSMPIKRFVKLRDDFDHVDNFFNIRKRMASNQTKSPVVATSLPPQQPSPPTSIVQMSQTMPPPPPSSSSSSIPLPPPSSSSSMILPIMALTPTKYQPSIVSQASNIKASVTGNIAVVTPSFSKFDLTSAKTAEQKKLSFSSALLESLNNKNAVPSLDVLTVPLIGEHAKVAHALGKQAEFSVSLLKGQSILDAHQKVEELTPEMTKFIAKQFDRRNDNADSKLLKASAILHLIVSALDSLVNCCLPTAANQIKVMAERNRTIVGDALDEAVSFLLKLSDKFSEVEIIHPKVVRLLEILKNEFGDGKNVEVEKKVMIVIEMDYATSLGKYLHDCISTQLKGFNVYFWVPVIQNMSEDVSEILRNKLSSHPIIISTSNILPLIRKLSSALHHNLVIIEYSYSGKNSIGADNDTKMVALKGMMVREGDETEVNIKGDDLSLEKVLLMQHSYTFITSQEFIQLPDVLFSLESNYKIIVIERSHSKMNVNMLRYCDVLIDHESGLLVDDISNLTSEEAVEKMVIRITGLSSNLKRCWVVLYNFNSSQLNAKLLSNYYVLVAAGSMVTSKYLGYEIKFLCCNSLDGIPPIIRQIADHMFRELIINKDDDTLPLGTKFNLLDKSFLTPDPTMHERILVAFPCFNSMSAQILLHSNSLRSLISSSLEDLQRAYPMIDPKFFQTFIKLRRTSSPMYRELKDGYVDLNYEKEHSFNKTMHGHQNDDVHDRTIDSDCFNMDIVDNFDMVDEGNMFVMDVKKKSYSSETETPGNNFKWSEDDTNYFPVKKFNSNKMPPPFGYMDKENCSIYQNFSETSEKQCDQKRDHFVHQNKFNCIKAGPKEHRPIYPSSVSNNRNCQRVDFPNYNEIVHSMGGSSGRQVSFDCGVSDHDDDTERYTTHDRNDSHHNRLFHGRNRQQSNDFNQFRATSFIPDNARCYDNDFDNDGRERYNRFQENQYSLDNYCDTPEMNWNSIEECGNHNIFSNTRKDPMNTIDHRNGMASGFRELSQRSVKGEGNEFFNMHSSSSSSSGLHSGYGALRKKRKLTYEFDRSLKHGQTKLKFV